MPGRTYGSSTAIFRPCGSRCVRSTRKVCTNANPVPRNARSRAGHAHVGKAINEHEAVPQTESWSLPSQVTCWVPGFSRRSSRGSVSRTGVLTVTRSVSRLRFKAFHRQAGRCYYCGVQMWLGDVADFAVRHRLSRGVARWLQCTAEHLKPRSDGGRDSAQNIVAACSYCNLRRHKGRADAPTPDAYRHLIQLRLSRRRWHAPPVFDRGLLRS